MNPILDALLTADSAGYLKPSHVQTSQAKELVDGELAVVAPVCGCPWEQLTPAGVLAAKLLREVQTEVGKSVKEWAATLKQKDIEIAALCAIVNPSTPEGRLLAFKAAKEAVSRMVQWDHGGDDSGALRELDGTVVADYWQRSPSQWAWRMHNTKPLTTWIFAESRVAAVSAIVDAATAAGWELVGSAS